MEDKLFCDRVAKGELSKNDILKFAESVEDKVHLCWLLFCRMPSTKTARAETECERLSMAMAWIETKYGFDWDGEYQDESTIKPIDDVQNEPQQMELKDLLPKKLKADEAVKVFQNAIDAKLITNSPEGLKWNDTKQLLAYFATKVSDKFNLTTKLDKDGNKTTDWKTFETLFEQKGLKGAKQNWMRLNTKFEPTGFEKVNALF